MAYAVGQIRQLTKVKLLLLLSLAAVFLLCSSSTAAAAPPESFSIQPTVIQVNDAQSLITALGVQTAADAELWETTAAAGMGVIGSDYRGLEEIGSAPFERKSYNFAIPDSINFWFPQKQPGNSQAIQYYKRTLSGIVDAEKKPYIIDIKGTYKDEDLNIDIRPFSQYMYLITDGHKPKMSMIQGIAELVSELKMPYKSCNQPFKFVHTEIDIATAAKNQLFTLINGRIGQPISVYGAWVYDKGHCHHPEIHPAEQIWWSEKVGSDRKYHLNIFCDSSKRFWWRHQMDGEGGKRTKLKPWGAPPIRGTFAIAFEVEMKTGKNFGKKFEVSSLAQHNVAVYPDGNKSYDLVYQDNSLISFLPNNDAFKVSYEKVGLKPGTTNIVRGFLVIETSVGKVTQIAKQVGKVSIPAGTDPNDEQKVPENIEEKAFKKEDGHYLFSVLQTNMK